MSKLSAQSMFLLHASSMWVCSQCIRLICPVYHICACIQSMHAYPMCSIHLWENYDVNSREFSDLCSAQKQSCECHVCTTSYPVQYIFFNVCWHAYPLATEFLQCLMVHLSSDGMPGSFSFASDIWSHVYPLSTKCLQCLAAHIPYTHWMAPVSDGFPILRPLNVSNTWWPIYHFPTECFWSLMACLWPTASLGCQTTCLSYVIISYILSINHYSTLPPTMIDGTAARPSVLITPPLMLTDASPFPLLAMTALLPVLTDATAPTFLALTVPSY